MLVIDNSIQDAQALVDFCVENDCFDTADQYYPGLRMTAPSGYVHALYNFLADLIDSMFGVARAKVAGGKSLYSMVVTPPEQLAIKQCLPHVDSFLSGDLACVHYLCNQDKGGTSLYRHKKTGYENSPVKLSITMSKLLQRKAH